MKYFLINLEYKNIPEIKSSYTIAFEADVSKDDVLKTYVPRVQKILKNKIISSVSELIIKNADDYNDYKIEILTALQSMDIQLNEYKSNKLFPRKSKL